MGEQRDRRGFLYTSTSLEISLAKVTASMENDIYGSLSSSIISASGSGAPDTQKEMRRGVSEQPQEAPTGRAGRGGLRRPYRAVTT